MSERRQHAPEIRAQVAQAVLNGEEPVAGLAAGSGSIRRVRAQGRKKPELDVEQVTDIALPPSSSH